MTTEIITVYECPMFGMMFGGSNLTFIKSMGVEMVLCPVCGGKHTVDNNQQIIEEQDYGNNKNGRVCERVDNGKERIRSEKQW